MIKRLKRFRASKWIRRAFKKTPDQDSLREHCKSSMYVVIAFLANFLVKIWFHFTTPENIYGSSEFKILSLYLALVLVAFFYYFYHRNLLTFVESKAPMSMDEILDAAESEE